MKILCIGDIFAKNGRRAIVSELLKIRQEQNIDLVIANAENATHCKGLIKKHYYLLQKAGIDFFTMGNHTWSKEEIYELLTTKFNIIRPYNIKKDDVYNKFGSGSRIIFLKNKKIRITNLLGESVFFDSKQTNPFLALDEIIKFGDKSDIHIVDFHAETTSEKNALFCAFQSQVSLIFGTHTHVQTADERILNKTAFITDVGMTGSYDSVIGADKEIIVNKFRNKLTKFNLEEAKGKYQFCYIIVEFDDKTNEPINIKRFYKYEK